MSDDTERLRRFLQRRRSAQEPPQGPEPEPTPDPPQASAAPVGPSWLVLEREGGRPSLYTQIVKSHERGATPAIAAAAAGVSADELSRWLLAGERGDSDYRDFWLACRAATSQFVMGCIEDVRHARDAKGNPIWPARKWLVESLEKGSYEPPPREVVAPGAPATKRAMLAELRKATAELERQLASESMIGQGEATAHETEAPEQAETDASDRSEDPTTPEGA